MRRLHGITGSMDMNLCRLQEMMRDGRPGVLWSMASQRVRYNLATERQHIEPVERSAFFCFFVCFHVYLSAPGLSCSM